MGNCSFHAAHFIAQLQSCRPAGAAATRSVALRSSSGGLAIRKLSLPPEVSGAIFPAVHQQLKIVSRECPERVRPFVVFVTVQETKITNRNIMSTESNNGYMLKWITYRDIVRVFTFPNQ